MKLDEAVGFLRPAIPSRAASVWADFGAGRGTFTEALASILGREATVFAVDHDRESVRALEALRDLGAPGLATVVAVLGDFRRPELIDELRGRSLDGALFANALHFVPDAEAVLRRIVRWVRPGGRLVVIEYDRTSPNPWVPHPLPPAKLAEVAARVGLGAPREVARRASSYHREMYCAVLRVMDQPAES